MSDPSAPVLTIDGPSGSGKGTISRRVAAELGAVTTAIGEPDANVRDFAIRLASFFGPANGAFDGRRTFLQYFAYYSTGRYFLLYFPIDELHHRCLLSKDRSRKGFPALCYLYFLLSAAGSRTDSQGQRLFAPV